MYSWQEPYLQAAQETDDTQIPHHLLEATAAIEQRLLSPIDEKSEEYRAIKNTWLGIQTLRKQFGPKRRLCKRKFLGRIPRSSEITAKHSGKFGVGDGI